MAGFPKNIKLRKVLSHIDGATHIEVYRFENGDEEEYFKGFAWDCPWWIAECYLDTDSEGKAMNIGIDKETKTPVMYIYVKGEGEE